MPRLFVALPVPEEIADALLALQSGVPDARWLPPENFHVTLCFAGEVHGAIMRDLEEELSDIAGPRFAMALAGVEQFSSRKQTAMRSFAYAQDDMNQCRLKYWTARSCFSAAARFLNVPRLRRLPVLG